MAWFALLLSIGIGAFESPNALIYRAVGPPVRTMAPPRVPTAGAVLTAALLRFIARSRELLVCSQVA